MTLKVFVIDIVNVNLKKYSLSWYLISNHQLLSNLIYVNTHLSSNRTNSRCILYCI